MWKSAIGTRTRREGFSLLEIAIAVVIMMLGMLPVMNLATAGLRETAMTREDILVRNAALDLLERFSGEKTDRLALLGDPSLTEAEAELMLAQDPVLAAAADGEGMAQLTQLGENLTIRRRIDFEKDGGGKPGLHRLTARVVFGSKGRGERAFTMHRFFFEAVKPPAMATVPTGTNQEG
ncbi:MAG: prepilin-type N-terminal cleavage/methylation domain-containing protein [Candidatus Wallbacteria bacterium]|nr:prepilin-type N-terminal cleavage/methylation domain-containing protein [Candidatus Wallbacteria bacterium]